MTRGWNWVQAHKGFSVFVVLVAIVVVAAVADGSSDSGTPKSDTFVDTTTGTGQINEVTAAPGWSLFAAKCTEDEGQLEREVRFAYGDLQDHGLGESYNGLVKHLNHSIPGSIAPTRCSDIIAAYLTLREPQ